MREITASGADLPFDAPVFWALLVEPPGFGTLILGSTSIDLSHGGERAWRAPADRPWPKIVIPNGATLQIGDDPADVFPGGPAHKINGEPVTISGSVSRPTLAGQTQSTLPTKLDPIILTLTATTIDSLRVRVVNGSTLGRTLRFKASFDGGTTWEDVATKAITGSSTTWLTAGTFTGADVALLVPQNLQVYLDAPGDAPASSSVYVEGK